MFSLQLVRLRLPLVNLQNNHWSISSTVSRKIMDRNTLIYWLRSSKPVFYIIFLDEFVTKDFGENQLFVPFVLEITTRTSKTQFRDWKTFPFSKYNSPFRKVCRRKITQEVFENVALVSRKQPTIWRVVVQDEINCGKTFGETVDRTHQVKQSFKKSFVSNASAQIFPDETCLCLASFFVGEAESGGAKGGRCFKIISPTNVTKV